MTFLVKLFLSLLAQLPAGGPYWLARRLAPLWMRLSPDKRRVATINIAACFPDLPPAEQSVMLKESFVHYLCSILEAGRNWYWPIDRLRSLCVEFKGEERVAEAFAPGTGVVALVPHFGAWEYLAMFAQQFPNFAIFFKPPAHEGLARALLDKRKRGGAMLLPATPSGLRQLYAHIRSGYAAAVLPDQQPSTGQGRFTPFYGIPALTGVMAPRLIQRTRCSVLMCAAERLDDGRYRVHLLPADPEIHSDDIDIALAALNRGVEQCIALDPAQYLWSYKRFRVRPEGAAPMYPI